MRLYDTTECVIARSKRVTQLFWQVFFTMHLCVLSVVFIGCPQSIVPLAKKLAPPKNYKPVYSQSRIHIDSLRRKYQEQREKGGVIDTTNLYIEDEELPIPVGSTSSEKALDSSKHISHQVFEFRSKPMFLTTRMVYDKQYPQEIEIRATVSDSTGRSILGLAPPYYTGKETYRSYWKWLQDSCKGLVTRIDSFTVQEIREDNSEPYAIEFVLDYSGSMGRERMERLRYAVRRTMNMIKAGKDGDYVGVLNFADDVRVEVPLSNDSGEYKKNFENAPVGLRGGTCIYDAVYSAVEQLRSAPQNIRKAIILFTDGADVSSKIELEQAARFARSNAVPIYAVGYGLTDDEPLQKLAQYTNGQFYLIYTTKEMPYVFADIYRGLKNYYKITYTPPRCTGLHNIRYALSIPELGVGRVVARGQYDKSLFSELDSVGVTVFVNIEFATNSFDLPVTAKSQLEDVVSALKDHPTMKIDVRGHTDDRGSDALNLKLSRQRAESVVRYLVSEGISSSRLNPVGFGSSKPLVPNASEEGRAKNRRTEFVVVK